jgi:tRNA(fMet)-specific endonuclease VapC
VSYLIDTSVCVAYLNDVDSALRENFRGRRPDEFKLCSVVKAELLYGARNSARLDENLQKLARFFEPFESLPFDDAAADHYGLIRVQLRRAGTPIGANDMLIAAIGLSRDLTIITRNETEFRRVAGLRVESW